MYINHKAHGAGAPPAANHNTATRRNTNNEPVGHAVHQPVHVPAQGEQREEVAKPPQKKNDREGGETPPTYEQKTAGAS